MLAGRLLLEASEVHEGAEIVDAPRSSVRQWRRDVENEGLQVLIAEARSGRKPRLNTKRKQQLLKSLLAARLKAGYHADLWTCRHVAEVVPK
jgi:transposase